MTEDFRFRLSVPSEILIRIHDEFDNNEVTKHYFTKYLKERCWQCSD